MNKEYVLKAVFVPKSMRTTISPCADMEGLDLFSVDCDDFTDYDRRENDEYLAYVTSIT